jgi:hypothetical protein
MAFIGQGIDQDRYRIAVTSARTSMVLVEHHGQNYRLPLVPIPRWTRPAEQLTKAIKAKWNLASIVIDYLPANEEGLTCAVIEIFDDNWTNTSDALSSLSFQKIDNCDFAEAEHAVLSEIISGNPGKRGPFSRIGWFTEARKWILESVEHRSVHLSTEITQFNAGGTFALVRFGTEEGPAFWLKATGAPNRHEFEITKRLAALAPRYLPPLVSAREDWNALIVEAVGHPLSDTPTLADLEQVLPAIAELQKQTVGQTEHLLGAGAIDQRIPALQSHLPQLMDYIEYAMEQQTSTSVPRLNRTQLQTLMAVLQDALGVMYGLGMPDTLIHNDLSSGNILFDGERCVFIDWSETGTGNPCLMPEQIYGQFRSVGDERAQWISRLKTLYNEAWLAQVGEQQLNRAFALAPVVATATRLCGRGNQFQSRRRDLDFLKNSRSLTRYMDRMAQSQEFLEAL